MPEAFSFVQLLPCFPERKGASYRTFQSVRGIFWTEWREANYHIVLRRRLPTPEAAFGRGTMGFVMATSWKEGRKTAIVLWPVAVSAFVAWVSSG